MRPRKYKKVPFMGRFLSKFEKDPTTGCWLWTAGLDAYGYGQVSKNRKMQKAHRVSYEIYVGAIPSGKHVLHKCDVRRCVNPDHLFIGTNQDNVDDMVAKGRVQRGSSHCRAKLTEQDVIAIRKDDRLIREISQDYGVHEGRISMIKNRKAWKHIP